MAAVTPPAPALSAVEFAQVIELLGQQGIVDVNWAESLRPPVDADDFADEAIFVICNSGMKNTVARGIFAKVVHALRNGASARTVFGHPGKSAAIDQIWTDRHELFKSYAAAPDRMAFLEAMPWIGGITKYHLAKNFGLDVAKPDVHLQRLADIYRTTPQELCASIAEETGYRIGTVDTVLWRACANGVIDSHTGKINRNFKATELSPVFL